MDQVRVAIVGAGLMAREHARAFRATQGTELVAIHSRTREKAEQVAAEHGIPQVAASIAEMAAAGANLVIVAVPELAAKDIIGSCLSHDWTMLLEKPAGHNLVEAEEVERAVSRTGKRAFVALNRRFYSSFLRIRGALETVAGERRFIHVQDQQSYAEARSHNHPEEVVRHFMYANSIHNIDLIRAFGRGAVSRVTPVMPWKGEQTEVVLAHVEFDSGDSGLYEGIWKGPGPWACSVSTPSQRWVMMPLEEASRQLAGQRRREAFERAAADVDFKPGLLKQADAVAKAVRGEPTEGLVTLAESLQTMRLIHAVFGV
jgi:predicted dehydrogenase